MSRSPNRQLHSCFGCQKKYFLVEELMRHVVDCRHTKASESKKRFPCDECDQTVSRKADLARHKERCHGADSRSRSPRGRKTTSAVTQRSESPVRRSPRRRQTKDQPRTKENQGSSSRSTPVALATTAPKPVVPIVVDDIGAEPDVSIGSISRNVVPLSPVFTPPRKVLLLESPVKSGKITKDCGIQCDLVALKRHVREETTTSVTVVDGVTITKSSKHIVTWEECQ